MEGASGHHTACGTMWPDPQRGLQRTMGKWWTVNQKALREGIACREFYLLNKAAGCCWYRGVDFPDCPEDKNGQCSAWDATLVHNVQRRLEELEQSILVLQQATSMALKSPAWTARW